MRAGSVVAIIMALAACRGRDAPPLLPADPPTPMATRGAAQSTLLDSGSTTLAGFGSRWTGDLDAMIDRRYIRALVTPSRTGYFVEAGAPHGISWEFLNAFEQDLNRRLPTGAKVRILYVPVPRDQLVRGLVEGRGDVAVAQITVTPGREQRVDFSSPIAEGVRELVVTSATGRPVNKPSDLSGREVFVRRSSSYWEHLVALNRALEAEGKPPVRLRAAPEHLDDEDRVIDHRAVPATGTTANEGIRVHDSTGRGAHLEVAAVHAAGRSAQPLIQRGRSVDADQVVVLGPTRHQGDDAGDEFVAFLLALLPSQELVRGAEDRQRRLSHAQLLSSSLAPSPPGGRAVPSWSSACVTAQARSAGRNGFVSHTTSCSASLSGRPGSTA